MLTLTCQRLPRAAPSALAGRWYLNWAETSAYHSARALYCLINPYGGFGLYRKVGRRDSVDQWTSRTTLVSHIHFEELLIPCLRIDAMTATNRTSRTQGIFRTEIFRLRCHLHDTLPHKLHLERVPLHPHRRGGGDETFSC